MKKNNISKLELDKSIVSKLQTNAIKGGRGNTVTVTCSSAICIATQTIIDTPE